MRWTAFVAMFTFLLWGTPLFAQDFDNDGVLDSMDNCSEAGNTAQDDTDGDECGNICDTDYDQDGVVGLPDIFAYNRAFGTINPLFCHYEPIPPDCFVGLLGWDLLWVSFGSAPGPSGTTAGTTACP